MRKERRRGEAIDIALCDTSQILDTDEGVAVVDGTCLEEEASPRGLKYLDVLTWKIKSAKTDLESQNE